MTSTKDEKFLCKGQNQPGAQISGGSLVSGLYSCSPLENLSCYLQLILYCSDILITVTKLLLHNRRRIPIY